MYGINVNFKKKDTFEDKMNKREEEAGRAGDILKETGKILSDLDDEFCRKTKLTKMDASFLFTAIGLQIVRQYMVSKFPERIDDQKAAKQTKGHGEEHSNRHHRYYNPSLQEIISNPVPFDANIGANGALKGGGGMGHRVTAIGHDPLLGLIFGTANIATSTLTTSSFDSYHISTNEKGRDCFGNKARTDLVISYTVDKLLNGGTNGRKIVAASLMKEIIHLKSDIITDHSLPLPMISAIDPKVASDLATYGLDMMNVTTVGKQATYALVINNVIAMLHGLFMSDEDRKEKKLYEVRTRKILSYSNLVASSSNVAVVAVTKKMNYLDLGGLAVTLHRLITDRKFIRQVKEDFIFGSYRDIVLGESII